MRTQDGGHHDAAIDALAERAYETAGDRYTRAGHRILADPREGLGPFEADQHGWVGQGLQCLLTAVVAYRVAGATGRATRRAVAGTATAADLTHGLDHPAQHACLSEFAADFRAAGDLQGVTDAYESVAQAYEAAADATSDPETIATSALFAAAATPLQQVARGQANGEIAITWENLHGSDPARPGAFLANRAQYKRQRFRSLVEAAVADGHLAAPRGTTEYDNDTYRCPNCGATDVNWAGSDVLCMRCSTPVERA